jgi:hypothetical protein
MGKKKRSGVTPRRPQLRRLIEDLRSTADYAVLPEEEDVVKIAFESDLDA